MVCCEKTCDKGGVCSRFLLIGFLSAGIALQVLAGTNCNFLTYGTGQGNGSVGILTWQPSDAEQCQVFSWQDGTENIFSENNYANTSRVMLGVALICACITMLLVLFEVLIVRVCCSRFCEVSAISVAQICTGLVFLVFGSPVCTVSGENVCTLGRGAWYNIGAWVAYFMTGLFICCLPKPKPLLRQCCCPDDGGKKKTDDVVPDKDDNADFVDEEQADSASYTPSHAVTGLETQSRAATVDYGT